MASRRVRDHESLLFVGTYGHVSALDKRSGNELWRTSLPGTGYLVVSIVYEDDTLFVGSGGNVFAVDPSNGNILWRNKLPGLHHGLVQVATMHSSSTANFVGLQQAKSNNNSAGTTT